MRGIEVNPDISNMDGEFDSEPRMYGDVNLDEDEKKVLELPPKYGVFRKLDEVQCKIDVEECLNKLRWNRIFSENDNDSGNVVSQEVGTGLDGRDGPGEGSQEGGIGDLILGNEEPGVDDEDNDDRQMGEEGPGSHDDLDEEQSKPDRFVSEDHVVDVNKLRATDLPYNPTVHMPRGLKDGEFQLHMFKRDIAKMSKSHSQKTKYGSNLDVSERRGLEKLKTRIKGGEIVCFVTDKSGRWSVDSPENYKKACKSHLEDVEKTIPISHEMHDKAENDLNSQGAALLRMLGLNEEEGSQGERLRRAITAHGVKIAPLYGTRKDHKHVEVGQEQIGPKVRPVCGAEDCATKRVSYILCLLTTPLIGMSPTHCPSTIDMLQEVDRLNQSGKLNRNCMVGSLDVESLYPSLDITRCAKVVSRKLYESDLRFSDLNWMEIGLYLVFHLTEQEMQEERISEYCPRRRSNRGEGPKFTASGSKLKKVDRLQPWKFPEERPNADMERRMSSGKWGVL